MTAPTRPHSVPGEPAELVAWLARMLAHDVGNVLTAIAGYAELIEADLEAGDPHMADATEIRDAALRAGGLVRQLLMVGRRRSLRIETIDATALVGNLAPLLGSATGDRVRLVLVPSREPAIVRADRSSLELALLNLAVNARDAMPDGGTVSVAVATGWTTPSADPDGSSRDPSGPWPEVSPEEVRITVEDTGTGIDAAILPRVFEPFFSTKAEHGSGIGLAAVEEAVALSGGRVTVESRQGEGARFTIHLPRASGITPERPTSRSAGWHLSGPATVLVVDPNAEVRLVLARLLGRIGFDVVDAATARQAEALAAGAVDRLDLLVTASALPDRPGRDLVRRIRSAFQGLPALVLSETPIEADGDAPQAPTAFLIKPCTVESLASAIRPLLPGATAD